MKDTIEPYDKIRVKLDALNLEQVKLFLAIEETEDMAKSIVREDKKDKYFPTVPFKNWTEKSTEVDLPMFGSIGAMYLCLWEYISLRYTDDTTVWDHIFVSDGVQQDIFNYQTPEDEGHPRKEYPGIHATIDKEESDQALMQLMNMINSITDQGEGGGVIKEIQARLGISVLKAVQEQFQPSQEALEKDYPSYTDTGKPAPSRDAAARGGANGAMDHYEIFEAVQELLEKGGIVTWDMWHAAGNKWDPKDLMTPDYDKNPHNNVLPAAKDIAIALNRLKENNTDANYKQLSQASAGAIAGVTTVLKTFWQDQKGTFPYPSMSGSGDRMSICWAIFGKHPDLSIGIDPKNSTTLYHACQGMNLDPDVKPSDSCAQVEVYHTCRGSNSCHAEGGCGFVQPTTGGGGCSAKINEAFYHTNAGNLCGGPKPPATLYSAPSDNKCATLGGCAVPISASQMFPAPAKGAKPVMQLFDFVSNGDQWKSVPIGRLEYAEGELVYDIAWKAYCEVLTKRQQNIPDKPAPSDFRLAFPPST
jgi:hypothetical protein